jgi:hypothetical protein
VLTTTDNSTLLCIRTTQSTLTTLHTCIIGKDYSGPSCCQNGFSCQDYAVDYKRCLPGQGEIETTTAPPVNPNDTSGNNSGETPSTPGDMTTMVCGEAGMQCGGRGKSYIHYTYICAVTFLLYTNTSIDTLQKTASHIKYFVIHSAMR